MTPPNATAARALLAAFMIAAWGGLAAAFLLVEIEPAAAAQSAAVAAQAIPAAPGEPAPALPDLAPRPLAPPGPVHVLGVADPPRAAPARPAFRPVVVARAAAPADLEAIVRAAAQRWGADAEQLLRVAYCESSYRLDAHNPSSGAAGLFQFIPATWRIWSQRAGFTGASPFDAVAAANTAAMMFAQGHAKQWVCR